MENGFLFRQNANLVSKLHECFHTILFISLGLQKMSRIWIAVVLGISLVFVSNGVNGERLVVHEGDDYTLSCNLTAKMMDPSSAVRSIIWLFKRSNGGAQDITLAIWKLEFLNQSFPTQPSFDEQYKETVSAVGHNGYFTLLVSNASIELHDGRFRCLAGSVTGKETVKIIDVVVSYGPQLQLNGSYPTVWANTLQTSPPLVCRRCTNTQAGLRAHRSPKRSFKGRAGGQPHRFRTDHHFSIRIQPTTETDFGAYDCTASNEAGSVSVLLSVLPDRRPDTPLNITVIANSTNRGNRMDSGPLHGRNEPAYRRTARWPGACPAGCVEPEREDRRRRPQHNTIYNVRLETVNSFGHASGPSNWTTFRTAAASAKPASDVNTDDGTSNEFVTVIATVGSVLLIAAVVVCLAMLMVRRRKHGEGSLETDIEMTTVRGVDRSARDCGAVPQTRCRHSHCGTQLPWYRRNHQRQFCYCRFI
ncbi:hypothetical protein BV898_09526 [Hypsibius exemplaris]|uniref:Ig-like domain-containing protein n=1 Tax=Hypsibius exemplaris TaxID=2072580 RepID=A0A1W0WMI0_HYPEX|nr:hypothetical protein BV898_09526 [Hypsibius exemplaris]